MAITLGENFLEISFRIQKIEAFWSLNRSKIALLFSLYSQISINQIQYKTMHFCLQCPNTD